MSIEDIVNVQISRETSAVSRAGFSVTLVLGISKAFTSLQRSYSNQKAVLEDFPSTSKEALATAAQFSQSIVPTSVIIGRRATNDITVVTVATVLDSTLYSVTINGTLFTFTSDASATDLEIALGLVTAINLGSEPVTASDNVDGTFDLTADVGGDAYSVFVDANQTTAFTTTDTLANDITNIQQQNDTWYGLVYTERTEVDVEAIAAYIETDKKLFVTASSDEDIINKDKATDAASVNPSIASTLNTSAYARSMVIYSGVAATAYPDAALLATVLPLDPGSWTAAYQELTSIAPDSLSSSQRTNALSKNANIYTEVGGANVTEDGKVAEGEFMDIIVFVDWMDARMTENIYALLVNSPKVPYTDAGIAAIEAEIKQVLQDGQTLGGITIDPGFSISVPKAADVSAGDKAARTLNGITFKATLTGAIHIVNVIGTVTL